MVRSETQPRTKVAYGFPGQGSQWVGMGEELYRKYPVARRVFEEADEALGFSLSQLCFEGPEQELGLTYNAQPAILTASVAYLKALAETNKLEGSQELAFVAGHSLGEYSALVAVGVVDLAEAVRIVRARGLAMHQAGAKELGAMAAILGFDESSLIQVCTETGAEIANMNCPGQIVISGQKKAVDQAIKLALAHGARRAIMLKVSGAFHSSLMEPALEEIAKIIMPLPFNDPQVPVVANASARPLTTGEEVKEELLIQLCSCVKWSQSIEYMVGQGVSTFVEVGPGDVLSGLIRRIDPRVAVINLDRSTLGRN